MGGEWRETTLDQLGRIVTGKTPPSGEMGYFDGDIPFVTPTDLDGRRIIDSTERYLTDQGAATVGGSRIPYQAVMVSCIGSDMGKAAVSGRECVTNQQINSVIVDSDDDPLFVYYNLSTRKAEIRAAAGGSAQPILNKSAFGRFDIYLPPPAEQRAIAHILGTLDDKIELNRRRNQTLEAMARALFQDWFVDFGPVRARMAGRARQDGARSGQPRTPQASDLPWPGAEAGAGAQGEPYLPAHLWQLFPDRLDDESKPEGWGERPLDEVADFLNGLALQKFPATDPDDSLPVIKIAELRNGISAKSDRASREVPAKYIIKDGDFLFSWSGSLLAKFWTEGEGALNQHLFKVTSERYPMWFVSHWVHHHLEEFQAIAASKATTMGHIQRGHLKAAMTICPPDDLVESMGIVMAPLVEQTIQNDLESRTLAQLRDTLLPKLISGELRIADAEQFLEKLP